MFNFKKFIKLTESFFEMVKIDGGFYDIYLNPNEFEKSKVLDEDNMIHGFLIGSDFYAFTRTMHIWIKEKNKFLKDNFQNSLTISCKMDTNSKIQRIFISSSTPNKISPTSEIIKRIENSNWFKINIGKKYVNEPNFWTDIRNP